MIFTMSDYFSIQFRLLQIYKAQSAQQFLKIEIHNSYITQVNMQIMTVIFSSVKSLPPIQIFISGNKYDKC